MKNYIIRNIEDMYKYINPSNTQHLTPEEINDENILRTNCGINSELLFFLLTNSKNNGKKGQIEQTFFRGIDDFELNESKNYKVYNIWKKSRGGHPHVSNFYFHDGKWIFVESTEKKNEMEFKEHTKESLIKFLQFRESLAIWQEICETL